MWEVDLTMATMLAWWKAITTGYFLTTKTWRWSTSQQFRHFSGQLRSTQVIQITGISYFMKASVQTTRAEKRVLFYHELQWVGILITQRPHFSFNCLCLLIFYFRLLFSFSNLTGKAGRYQWGDVGCEKNVYLRCCHVQWDGGSTLSICFFFHNKSRKPSSVYDVRISQRQFVFFFIVENVLTFSLSSLMVF